MTGTQTIGEPTALSGDQTTGLRSGEASGPNPDPPDVQPDGSAGTDETTRPSGPPKEPA